MVSRELSKAKTYRCGGRRLQHMLRWMKQQRSRTERRAARQLLHTEHTDIPPTIRPDNHTGRAAYLIG